jgi:hypothetical protein
MRKRFGCPAVASLAVTCMLALPYSAWSYASFQRLPHVSDGAPYCAGCHSSVDAAYHSELPADTSQSQVYNAKHYKPLEEGSGPYKPVEPDQRKQLLELAKLLDQHSTVKLEASATTVAPGGTVTVTVSTKGGIGPVVGIMLVDEPLRYQARPIQGTGWFISATPEVIGSDGKPQGNWLERRVNKQQTNLNFVLVYGVNSEPAKNTYAASRVSYQLKAPAVPGEYPITAAFLYGTSDADELKTGKYVDPPGGGTAPSGRIQFSNVVRVRVQ